MNFTIIRGFPSSELQARWRDYLARLQCPSHYDSPDFFLEPFWTDQKPFAVLALRDKQIVGVLTGLHAGKNVVSGLASRPQISVDPSENSGSVLEVLLEGLLTEAVSAELVSVYSWAFLKLPSFVARGFRSQQLAGNVVLDLTQGAENLFKQFSKDCRRNIRFAEKNGVEVSEAETAQDVVDAYEVYCAWRETERKNVVGEGNSFEVFERAVSLKNNRRLFLARVGRKIIAINRFRFCPGGLFESSGNSSLDEFIHLKPNNLLQWRGIQWACRYGLRRHSLGGSHPFLLRFGGTVEPIVQYRLDQTWLHRHELRSTVQGVGRQIARKLPRWVVKGLPKPARKKGA